MRYGCSSKRGWFRCRISDVEDLPQELKLAIQGEEKHPFIQQDQAIAVFKEFDNAE